jgi:hypothetical protein
MRALRLIKTVTERAAMMSLAMFHMGGLAIRALTMRSNAPVAFNTAHPACLWIL